MDNHLVVGLGEVGSAIQSIFGCPGHDPRAQKPSHYRGERVEFLHVCFPYTDSFGRAVRDYQERFLVPLGVTVVHSTVPVGTTAKLLDAVHAPVRGQHPNLQRSIRTFPMPVGGERELAIMVVGELQKAGVPGRLIGSSADTEAMKLWSTLQYGWAIALEKEIHAYCEERGLDPWVVYEWGNLTYNQGYGRLGRDHYRRPVLEHVPGPIGGHCVIPNAAMLGHWLGDMLVETNEEMYKEKQ